MSFVLHPQLAGDTLPVASQPLCHVLLMDDARFPWLILVPGREGLREVFDLETAGRCVLMEEVSHAASVLQQLTQADKINIAALGNQVPQLHVHVIARFAADAAWPNPVWCCTAAKHRYTKTAKARLVQQLQAGFEAT